MPDVKITRLADTAVTPATESAHGRELDAIRQLAYSIYLQRGDTGGSELDDWLTAERIVLGLAATELTENDGAYAVDMPLPGFDAADVEIAATENEVVVHALLTAADGDAAPTTPEAGEPEVYRRFRMPTPITFERISAEFHDGVLHVRAPKSAPPRKERSVLVPA